MSLKSSVKTDHPLFSEALGMVYCGLTDEEALRLAMRHNVNGHFTHGLTHRDYVSCRVYILQLSLWMQYTCMYDIVHMSTIHVSSVNIRTCTYVRTCRYCKN